MNFALSAPLKMKHTKVFFLVFVVILLTTICSAQSKKLDSSNSNAVRSTPAYAEILLRKTDLEADIEDFMVSYTEDYPKVKESRYELGLINSSLNKLLAVSASESSKLTLALGKLLVRKAQLETDMWSLKTKYGDEHPEVKRASRKVAAFEKAIREILP